MMRPFLSLGAIFSLLLLHGSARTGEATNIIVEVCEDLVTAVSYTSTATVTAEITSAYISCPSWTSFEIKENQLILEAAEHLTDVEIQFYNVRFVVSSELRVDIPVRFDGDEFAAGEPSSQVNGGIFHVEQDARAEFFAGIRIDRCRVDTGATDAADVTPDAGRGACVYNEARFKVHGSFKAKDCRTSLSESSGGSVFGDGGAIWNGENGRLTVKGVFEIECSSYYTTEGDSRGGAIYNAGKIDFYEDASFTGGCYAATGGTIYNEGRIRFYEDSFAYFTSAWATGNGGHIFNSGNIFFLGGAHHYLGNTDLSGGGIYNEGKAIYNPGTSVTFETCGADEFGGGIVLTVDSTFDLPEDAVFDGNYIRIPDPEWDDSFVDQCDDIYLETDTGYTCLTSWPPE